MAVVPLLLLGPVVIAGCFYLAVAQVEPFASHFYLMAWCGLIFTCDRAIHALEGRSLIRRCGPGFALLLFWSAVVWFFFELVNLRLQNWYYVFVTDQYAVRLVGTLVAFATVFPGIFWISHLLAHGGFPTSLRARPWRVTPTLLARLQFAGAVMLVLVLLFPRYCFPLVWCCTVLLVAPANYRRGVNGLLKQFGAGEYAPTLRLLLAGLLAGGLWEFFNFWARAKWIYTVPLFDELKLFEMPVAGFLGFPPFAVECACLYRLLVWHRLAPAFSDFAERKNEPNPRALLPVAVMCGCLFSLAVFTQVDRYTISSTTPRVRDVVALKPGVRELLSNGGVEYLTQLQGLGAGERWRDLSSQLSVENAANLRRTAELYLHQGIGVVFGNQLSRLGIASLDDLRRQQPDQLLHDLRAVATSDECLPTAAQIKVWLRRLPE